MKDGKEADPDEKQRGRTGGLEGGEPIIRMLCEKRRFSIRGIKVKN